MKRISILLFLLFAGTGIQAQGLSFSEEELDYSIRHNLFPGTIGTMIFQGEECPEGYHVDAVLKAAVGNIYTLDCNYGATFCNDAALTPISATRSQVEKKYWAKGRYDWSAPGKVHLDVTKSTRPPRDEMLEWDGTVRDLLGTIWWLRTLDYSSPQPADGNNALLLDHDALPVVISSFQRKTVKIDGTQTPVIEVALAHDGKEALRVTLSDDARRIPLKFSIALPFGNIKGTLKKKAE